MMSPQDAHKNELVTTTPEPLKEPSTKGDGNNGKRNTLGGPPKGSK